MVSYFHIFISQQFIFTFILYTKYYVLVKFKKCFLKFTSFKNSKKMVFKTGLWVYVFKHNNCENIKKKLCTSLFSYHMSPIKGFQGIQLIKSGSLYSQFIIFFQFYSKVINFSFELGFI